MRHQQQKGKLDRTTAERKSLLRSLATALLTHQRIITTLAKAKEAGKFTERLITIGKKGGLSSHRRLFSYLLDRDLVKEITSEIAPRFKNRQGGYTRIIKISGRRKGDGAQMAIIELTEQKIVVAPEKKAKKEKKPQVEEQKQDKAAKEELPKEGAPKKEEQPKHPSKKEEKRHHIEKPKKGGFFQGIQRFLKPKTGGG